MKRIKMSLFAALLAGAGLAACADDSTSGFRSAITGEACEPDPATLRPHGRSGQNGNGGHNSPTGIPGDNMDDEHSGKVDCYYDGNSGQGDDKKHPCCDDSMCCNGDPDDGEETPPTDPTDPGDGDDGDGEETPPTDPTDPVDPAPEPDPEPLPPVDSDS
jgi:hypothetical protein